LICCWSIASSLLMLVVIMLLIDILTFEWLCLFMNIQFEQQNFFLTQSMYQVAQKVHWMTQLGFTKFSASLCASRTLFTVNIYQFSLNSKIPVYNFHQFCKMYSVGHSNGKKYSMLHIWVSNLKNSWEDLWILTLWSWENACAHCFQCVWAWDYLGPNIKGLMKFCIEAKGYLCWICAKFD
jgi:hypothetical protein